MPILAAPLLVAATAVVPATTVALRPVISRDAVIAIDVAMILPDGVPQPAWSAPIVYPGAPGVASRMADIAIEDPAGRVPLTVADDPAVPGGFPYYRHWRAARAVGYPVRVRYRALVQPPGGAGGPPFGLRAVGGGVAGSGATLLLVPDGQRDGRVQVGWDLSGFARGASATTSFGDGDFAYVGGIERLTGAWLIAGPAGRLPLRRGFGAAWLGTPTFDAPREMARAAAGHAWLQRYFPHLRPSPPYRVFLQFRDAPPYGGATALDQSFMLSRGPLKAGEDARAPLGTIFHEMIHQWVGQIEAPQGVSSWFSEGLTSYYEAELPMRGGFQSVADYGAHIDAYTRDYYGSKARNWSAERITKVGFGDEEVRHTPYRRSELYFHDLDARIRARSGGRRTLDSLLFPMFVAREHGERFDQARWIAMVAGELGEGEAARFERLILQGLDTLEPREDAFGPCFRRQQDTFVHDGRQVAGFRWMRVPGVPDATCRRR